MLYLSDLVLLLLSLLLHNHAPLRTNKVLLDLITVIQTSSTLNVILSFSKLILSPSLPIRDFLCPQQNCVYNIPKYLQQFLSPQKGCYSEKGH